MILHKKYLPVTVCLTRPNELCSYYYYSVYFWFSASWPSWVEKVGGRKVQFSIRALQISDSKSF